MWISIGKCSQNIKIKRIPDENNNKVTKTHEYCSTNKATGRIFSKWCIIMLKSFLRELPRWTWIKSNIMHSWTQLAGTLLQRNVYDVPLPLSPFQCCHLSIMCLCHLANQHWKGKGRQRCPNKCVWECRPAPLWKLIWISEDNEPDE